MQELNAFRPFTVMSGVPQRPLVSEALSRGLAPRELLRDYGVRAPVPHFLTVAYAVQRDSTGGEGIPGIIDQVAAGGATTYALVVTDIFGRVWDDLVAAERADGRRQNWQGRIIVPQDLTVGLLAGAAARGQVLNDRGEGRYDFLTGTGGVGLAVSGVFDFQVTGTAGQTGARDSFVEIEESPVPGSSVMAVRFNMT